MASPVYALNWFNVKDREEYLTYVRRSATEVPAHGGKVVALGRFLEARVGDVKQREIMLLVEWASREALQSYIDDPALADLHPHRVDGTADYVWHFFEKLEDFRPVLKGIKSPS